MSLRSERGRSQEKLATGTTPSDAQFSPIESRQSVTNYCRFITLGDCDRGQFMATA